MSSEQFVLMFCCFCYIASVRLLPCDCGSLNVAVVSNTVPIYDQLCRRVMNFIHSRLHCDSNSVQSIVLNSISAGMNSPIGRNVTHCSAHFTFSLECFGVSRLCSCKCLNICYIPTDTQSVDRANVVCEVMMISDGLLEFSSDLFEVFLSWMILLNCQQVDLPSSSYCTFCTKFIIKFKLIAIPAKGRCR